MSLFHSTLARECGAYSIASSWRAPFLPLPFCKQTLSCGRLVAMWPPWVNHRARSQAGPVNVLPCGCSFWKNNLSTDRGRGALVPLAGISWGRDSSWQPCSQLLPAPGVTLGVTKCSHRQREAEIPGVRREAVRTTLGPAALSSTGESPDSPTN